MYIPNETLRDLRPRKGKPEDAHCVLAYVSRNGGDTSNLSSDRVQGDMLLRPGQQKNMTALIMVTILPFYPVDSSVSTYVEGVVFLKHPADLAVVSDIIFSPPSTIHPTPPPLLFICFFL
jgi:hypothetical protein